MAQNDSTLDARPRRRWIRMAVVGAAVLTAMAIFAIVARRTFLRHEVDLSTLIDDSAGIGPSSPVLLNGIDVGHVVRVTLSGSRDPDKTVRITMRFPRRILTEIPVDSTAAITSANLLGDKYIDISRGKSLNHVEAGGQIVSTPTQDISTALSSANAPLEQINRIFAHADKILGYINSPQGTLGKFLNNSSFQKHLTAVSGDQSQIVKNVSGGAGLLARFNEISAEVQKPLARLNAVQTAFQQGGGSLGKLLNDPSLTTEAHETINEANQLISDFNAGNRTTDLIARIEKVKQKVDDTVAHVNAGQGTVGQLIASPNLRDSLERVRQELDGLVADIKKHPTHFVRISFALF